MMKWLERGYRKLQNCINVLTAIQLSMIIGIIFIQVIMRMSFSTASLVEEFCRYLFVWVIVLGLSIPIRERWRFA
jgi:TRAP-type C4-dicarboxylate transport system permease small subunit